jgi:hypothetical protein
MTLLWRALGRPSGAPISNSSYYKVRIIDSWLFSTRHWSGQLSESQYRVPLSAGLEPYTTYSFRVYAFGDPADSEIDLYSCNHLIITANAHFTAGSAPEECEGDFDEDGDVDVTDIAVIAADFGRTVCDNLPPCKGDLDNDGDCDGSDLASLAAEFGRTDCPMPQ